MQELHWPEPTISTEYRASCLAWLTCQNAHLKHCGNSQSLHCATLQRCADAMMHKDTQPRARWITDRTWAVCSISKNPTEPSSMQTFTMSKQPCASGTGNHSMTCRRSVTIDKRACWKAQAVALKADFQQIGYMQHIKVLGSEMSWTGCKFLLRASCAGLMAVTQQILRRRQTSESSTTNSIFSSC